MITEKVIIRDPKVRELLKRTNQDINHQIRLLEDFQQREYAQIRHGRIVSFKSAKRILLDNALEIEGEEGKEQ